MGDDDHEQHLEAREQGSTPGVPTVQGDRVELNASVAGFEVSYDPSSPERGERRKRGRRRRNAEWANSIWGEAASTVLLGILLIGAPQLLGGVLPWTMNVIACVSVACLALIGLRAPAARMPAPRLAFVLAAAWAWTAVQALPLPCNWVAAIAPDSAKAAREPALLLGAAAPSFCTLSQDPGATHVEIIKGSAIVTTFFVSWLFAASGGRRRLLRLIAGATLAMSTVAFAHALLGLDSVFGLYPPIAHSPFLAPLMNPNNLGAFAALGVPLWIGLTYHVADPNDRLLGYVGVTITTTTTVLTQSRGALGQLALSMVAVLWIVMRRRSRDAGRQRTALRPREVAFVVAAACGLAGGGYLVGAEALSDVGSADIAKLELGARTLRFGMEHPWIGIGRGAFGSAFVAQNSTTSRFRYAENFIAQWVADWGLPIAFLLVLTIAIELWGAARSTESFARLAAITALCAFAAQNLVDLGLENVGVAIVAAALLAACVAPSSARVGTSDHDAGWRSLWPRPRSSVLVAIVLVGAVGALIGLGPRLTRESVPELEVRLRAPELSGDRDLLRRGLREAFALHPLEPILALLAAGESIEHKEPNAGGWVNLALRRAPGWARSHELAFRWLWQKGRGQQALLELRTAAEVNPTIALDDACKLARRNGQWALRLMPRNLHRRQFLERVASCASDVPSGVEIDRVLVHEFPDSRAAAMRAVLALQQSGKIEESLARVDAFLRARPSDQEALLTRFRILLAGRRFAEIIDETSAVLPHLDEAGQADILGIQARAFARAGAREQALQTVSEIRRRVTNNVARLAASLDLEGQIHQELNEQGEALVAFREAYSISTEPRYLGTIAAIAESLGDRPLALWAYINLCQREPLSGACQRRNALLSPGAKISP